MFPAKKAITIIFGIAFAVTSLVAAFQGNIDRALLDLLISLCLNISLDVQNLCNPDHDSQGLEDKAKKMEYAINRDCQPVDQHDATYVSLRWLMGVKKAAQ